jgi:hypothetical protein
LTITETEAAAALTDSILGQLAGDGYDKAAELLAADGVVPQPAVAAPPQVPSSPPAVATATEPNPEPEPESEAQTEVPSFEPDIPEDLQELLNTPDFEEEAALEVAAELD